MEEELGFFSLNRPSDWSGALAANLRIAERGMSVRQTNKYVVCSTVLFADLFRMVDHAARPVSEVATEICDAAAGPHGTLYLLDEQANLWALDVANGYRELLFRAGHGLFGCRAVLLGTGELIVIADPESERKVAAYLPESGQCLWSLDEWGERPLYPMAMAAETDGTMRMIAAEAAAGAAADGRSPAEIPAGTELFAIWIDRSGRISQQHTTAVRTPRRMRMEEARRRYLLACPGEGRLALLDTETKEQIIYSARGEIVERRELSLPQARLSGFAADSKGHMYIGDGRDIRPVDEDNRFIYRQSAAAEPLSPLSGFRGKADKLFFDRRGKMYVFDRGKGMLTVLALKPRTMELEPTGLPEAVYVSLALDSTAAETRWHKIVLDADIPAETQIRISYFAADRKQHILLNRSWDLDEFLASGQIPFPAKMRALEPLWSKPLVNPRDALLFAATGRYLWLKIEFSASEAATPLLRKLRVYYPRTSYLSYLPAMYQEDAQSRDFLERFLSLFGTFFQEMEEEIAGISRYFDAETVPPQFLRWLGGWVGIADDFWSDAQLAELIRRSPELYPMRGTREGIAGIVEIYTGERPIIVEYFQYRTMLEQPELREIASRLFGLEPYSFCVMVRQERVPGERERAIVQRLIDEQKPAYTEAKLIVLEPWMYLDMHTYLGINTYLSEPSWQALDRQTATPFNTVLSDEDRHNRLDRHTRLGADSALE